MKLLIIEDEAKTASYLKKALSEQGFVVDTSENGEPTSLMLWTIRAERNIGLG